MASNLFNINVNDPLNGNVSNIANQDWYTADGTTTSPVSAYQYDAYNLLFSTELSGWEVNSVQNPYQLDLTVSDVNGDPTIGIGIDLHTNSGALTSYFNVPAGAEHNALAAQYASPAAYNAGLANGGATGFTITAAQSEAAFKHYEQVEETKIDNVLYEEDPNAAGSAPVVGSTARLALLDLAYNSTLFNSSKSPTLFSDLADGNQADAWFQIAFNSNDYSGTGDATSASPSANTARRWEDASLIGLYDNADTSAESTMSDALSTYAMLSGNTNHHGLTNRTFAFNYSNAFASAIATVSSTDTSQSLYALTNNNVDSQLSAQGLDPLQTGDLEANLTQAATTLIQHYVLNASVNPFLPAGTFSASSFSALDVQVARVPDSKNPGGSDLVASHRDGYNLTPNSNDANAQDYNSLLIAQGGNVTLDASASSANDVLIGGTGNDTILGGTGNDYIVAGKGNDSIVLIGGNDTVVLGDAFYPADGGNDTVDATKDSGSVSYYVGAGTHETIKLGSGTSTLYLVPSASSVALKALSVSANFVTPGVWYDATDGLFFIQQIDPATGKLDPGAASKNIEIIKANGSAGTNSAQASKSHAVSNAELMQMLATAEDPSDPTSTIELTLDGFTGSSDDGITLGAAPPAPPQPGASNLNSFSQTTSADFSEFQDFNGRSANDLDSIYGTNTTGGNFNVLEGEGNAGYIYAGDGNNYVFAFDLRDPAATEVLDLPIYVTIQGGSGDQLLVGMGNGHETIIGGDAGQDTAAWDTIDGGGATALLTGGSQNSLIFGGTGADTLTAGSAATGSAQPSTIAIAGLSFWGSSINAGNGSDQVTGEPGVAIAAFTDPANFQIDIALSQLDGSYAAPMGLLGSSLDSGQTNGSATLPGSELIGGTGLDYLIGNRGNDTLIGGNPLSPVAGVIDEVLVGGAGADLIYGGDGTELIYADMSPGAVSTWADLDAGDADTIYAGSGNEYIYGSGGNDVIDGGSGNYTIYAGNGNSYVATGTGNTAVYGGMGNDTIIVEGALDDIHTGDGNAYVEVKGGQSTITTGAGNDTIEADGGDARITAGSGHMTVIAGVATGSDTLQSGTGGTTVQLSDGLTEFTLVARDVNGDLVLSNAGFAAQITVGGYFNSPAGVALQFTDGTTWSAAQILQASMTPSADGSNDTLVGSNGSDSIIAGFGDTSIVGVSGNNTLTGGAGNDTIQGGSGTDMIEGGSGTTQVKGGTGTESYLFNIGDGSETISEDMTSAGTDALQFGPGIDASDVTFARGSSPNDLVISFGAESESTITVSNFLVNDANQHQIGEFKFSDGSSLAEAYVETEIEAIYGTIGDETLNGTIEADYFDGKGGNDVENGDGGNDTFVFDSSYGQLDIQEILNSSSHTTLRLGAGIKSSSLRVTADMFSLYLTDSISGDKIELLHELESGVLYGSGEGISTVQFSDGTTLTGAQLVQMEINGGTTGNDNIYGTTDADLIDGRGGNDFEDGNGGSDTFVFNVGYGQLEVGTTGERTIGNNKLFPEGTLRLGSGITASTLHVAANREGLTLTDGISGDLIVLDGVLDDGMLFGEGSVNAIAKVEFGDGTTLTTGQLFQMELSDATNGNDTLYGTTAANLINGKGGDDVAFGNDGSDTFVFNAGYGRLEINNDFSFHGVTPVLMLGQGVTQSSLRVTNDGTNLYLTDGVNGDQVQLDSMWLGYGYGVATVQLADGTTLTADQLIHQIAMTGTVGNDTINGTSGADLIDGKGGNDSVVGGGGNDTFVFNAGYGDLEINEAYLSGQTPALQLGAGIMASALHATKSGNNLVLTDGVSGDQITLDGMWTTASDGVANLQLADGTTLTRTQMIALEMTGTTGNDTITGTSGADLIDGKRGNDSVVGNGGNDTFVFNSGYGDLEINEVFKSGQVPTLQLGTGITASALHATKSGNNLVLTDGVSGDQITLDNMWTTATAGIASVQLSNGTTLTRAQIIALEMTGTTGSDTITGTSGADLIDGKSGNDSVVGGGGNDTFVFNSGYGHLEINEVYTSGQTPVLQLGAGITASALHVTTNGTNVVLTDGVTGDQITLDKMWSTATDGVASAHLSNGTTLTRAQIIALEMTGTTGSDTILGTSGAELIDGKGGSDSVTGNGGNDTFVYNSGYGHLAINETYTSGQAPVLQLGAGITTSTLKVAKSGNNLVLTDGVTGDQITLTNMSSSSTSGVATVKLASGTSLTRAQLIGMETASVAARQFASSERSASAQINTLIHAMAGYSGYHGGEGGMGSSIAAPMAHDLMLHAAVA